MDRKERVLGSLLGGVIGDSVGLPREGLSASRAERLFGSRTVGQHLIFGRGLMSDDGEHALLTLRALALERDEPRRFQQQLARELRNWILTAPAGVGLATLKACTKLLVGYPPSKAGVNSAGNGPAMRAPILGAALGSKAGPFVNSSTLLTHTHPLAVEGASILARAAALAENPAEFWATTPGTDDTFKAALKVARDAIEAPMETFVQMTGFSRGVSGFILHSTQAALYCWSRFPLDFRGAIEAAIRLGGDTDTVAAITGGIVGAAVGPQGIPSDWIDRLWNSKRTLTYAESLVDAFLANARLPQARPGLLIERPLLLAAVLGHGFRRIAPPY